MKDSYILFIFIFNTIIIMINDQTLGFLPSLIASIGLSIIFLPLVAVEYLVLEFIVWLFARRV